MAVWFDVGAALFALLAAWFWFASAAKSLPRFDDGPPPGGLIGFINQSARMNRRAAFFAGLSALCAAGHTIVNLVVR